jgi:hypothetical protein
MLSILSAVSGGKTTVILISLMVVITVVDSQFIKVFYGTDLGTPGDLHLILFLSFVIVASIINIVFMIAGKSHHGQSRTSRPLLFRVSYIGTSLVQYTILLIMFIVISQVLTFHGYSKIFSLLVVYLSHLWSAVILGVLSLIFIQWFRSSRSFSILIYGVVFMVILFLILITIPLLTEQFSLQPLWIYPRDYMSLILGVLVPSPDIAYIYGLGSYALPVMVIASWTLTVSLLRPYAGRIGKKTFWLIVSLPLLYEVFSLIVSDTNLVTDPGLVETIYSGQFQVVYGISNQISGLFLAVAFWITARKMKRKNMKHYLIISSIGIISLFSSMQPGTPFYAAYPPFGLVTLSFLGLSSYLLLVGIIGCATYVSRDSELRREVYKDLEANSDVLKMGMAEMQREIENRVRVVVEKIKLSDEPDNRLDMDPDEEDVKIMIAEVMNEIHPKGSQVKPDKR